MATLTFYLILIRIIGQTTTNRKIGESEGNKALRFQEKMITRALSLSEIKEVKGILFLNIFKVLFTLRKEIYLFRKRMKI